MYWTSANNEKIQRANLDGSEIEDLISVGLDFPVGIALDVESGKMYWVDAGTQKLQRANLDGTDVEDLVTAGVSFPRGIAIDRGHGKVYWTDAINLTIRRADVDGSNVEILVKIGLSSPGGIALDLRGNVPAVGNIGMVVMVALLLGAGAVVLARRQGAVKHRDVA